MNLKQFLQILDDLLPKDQARETAKSLATKWPDPKSLARELVKRGWLTTFQATKIFEGKAASLVLGPFVLLELLGEGGMGLVYRARHRVMDRVVALKIIRADRMANADAVARFEKEVKAAAKLSHPNIVAAYDAAAVGATHFFAMEYVEGSDLGKLIKARGALPVEEACEYVRQAALGLQHAHENGLVHRDVKPANLMCVKRDGTVKVLDLGLARLRTALASDQTASELTREGSIMGTPDYLAPEQAANPGGVDIRADIYSLGCTLYHLLTGQVPFPGGTLAQKLQWHQQAEPATLETVRRDLPAGLGDVVRKMLVKKPVDRWQTPAEVAEALAPFCGAVKSAGSSTITQTIVASEASMSTQQIRPAASSGCSMWIIGLLVVALLVTVGALGLVGGLWFMSRNTGKDRVTKDAQDAKDDKDNKIEVLVRLTGVAKPEAPKETVFLLDKQPIDFEKLSQEIALAVGSHELVVERAGVVLERRDFLVIKDDHQQRVVIPEIELKPGKVTSFTGHVGEVSDVAFSGDGLRLLSVGPAAADGVFIWEVATGRNLHHYKRGKGPAPKGYTWSGALSRDGNAALIGSKHTFKGQNFKPWLQSIGLESGAKLWEYAEHAKTINTVEFSRNGKLALSADEANVTIVWDATTGARVNQLAGTRACFSPTADRVLTSDKTHAQLWKLGAPVQELQVFKGHSDLIRGVAFAPDGLHVVTCGDTTARLWNVQTGQTVRVFKGHEKEVTSVAIAPDGRRLLTGSKDKTVRLWNIATGEEMMRFSEHTDVVTCVAYSPGGRRAASGSLDHTVRVWALPR